MATAIGKLEDDFARFGTEKKDAAAARDKEHADHIKVSTDLTDFIEKSNNKVAEFITAIGKLEDNIGRLDAEQKDATAARDKEHAASITVVERLTDLQNDLQQHKESTEQALTMMADGMNEVEEWLKAFAESQGGAKGGKGKGKKAQLMR